MIPDHELRVWPVLGFVLLYASKVIGDTGEGLSKRLYIATAHRLKI